MFCSAILPHPRPLAVGEESRTSGLMNVLLSGGEGPGVRRGMYTDLETAVRQ